MFIQNVSMEAIKSGKHRDAGDGGVLIQITDCGGSFPTPRMLFDKIFQFDFYDVDNAEIEWDNAEIEWGPQPRHGDRLVAILKMALKENRNVIVHCHAGLCRSGAVAEVGVIMGFEDTGVTRIPNLLVKKYMMQTLGLTYDFNEARKEQWHDMSDTGIVIAKTAHYF